jgi:hypothetical protein
MENKEERKERADKGKKHQVRMRFLLPVSFGIPVDIDEIRFMINYKLLLGEQYRFEHGEIKRNILYDQLRAFRHKYENTKLWKKFNIKEKEDDFYDKKYDK